MSFDRAIRTVAGLLLFALVVLAGPAAALAQTTSASVSGKVQDTQGGVLPGVTVTLTSHTQGNTLTTTTDPDGRFVFAIVRPDTYSLQVALQGFKTLERSNVVVSANDKFFAGVLTLDVGQLTEEVTVSSRVTEVQATSGERSFTLESEALKNIANNGRAVFNFATLVPGALPGAMGGGEIGTVSGFTVNGMRPNSNNVTIDGVANVDTGDNGGNMATTNIDAVSEFKVLTNAYQAEYGRAVGGQVQVVTKSGTQDFRGSGYWYGRRSGWNANTWLNKRVTPEIEPPKASRNDSGYTIGGPVFFPGVFNTDRKKLFFFFSQEHQRRKDPVAERRGRVPTALERQGDFSQSVDDSGDPFPYIRDHTTGLPCGPADTRGCFAHQGVLGRIAPDRIYQPGLAALGIYPSANFSGGGGLNFTSQIPDEAPRREDLLRLDFQASANWRVTGRYMKTKEDILQAYGTTWAGSGSNQIPMPVLFQHPGSNYVLSTTGVLSPSMSIEVSWGRASNSLDFDLQLENLSRSAAGLSAFPLLFPEANRADYVPDFIFGGAGRTNNAARYQTNQGPFTNENVTHDVIANLTKVWGSHASKAGFYFQHSFKPQSLFASFNGQVNFTDDTGNPFDTGFSYANAATGVFNTYQQASKFAIPEWRYKNIEWYVQDNWKAASRLTIDYGVRFYYLTPQWDTTLQASNFLPDRYDPASAVRLFQPAIADGRRVGYDALTGQTVAERFIGRVVPGSGDRFNGSFQAGQGIDEALQDGSAFRVSPRVGVVLDLTGKSEFILRGGWGIFYDRPQGNMVFNMITNAPGVLQPTLQWGRLQDLTAAGGDPNPTLTMNPSAYDFKPPRVYQWNVGVQRKLWQNLIFDLAYVGSKSKDLLRGEQINALPRGTTFLPESQDPTRASSATPGATALPTDLLRPFRGYGNITMLGYTGYSNYHALQTGVNRRFDNGLLVSAFYVWSKALGINSTDFAAGAPNLSEEETKRLDYSYVDFDRPHNFVANFIYQSRQVTSSRVLGLLANDWQLSGVYRWTSGRPYTVNYSIPGIGNANLTGNDGNPAARIVLLCDPGRGWSGDPYRQLDASCFGPPQPGSDGAESARFFVRTPPINNLDLSLAKSFAGPRRLKFEVRLDAFNALNHTQFTFTGNATANFASLTDRTITNLPYDANGNLVRPTGFGAINGVAAPRTLQLVTRVTF